MTRKKLQIIKVVITRILWILVGVGTFVLLGAAMNKKSFKKCQKVEVTIKGAHNNIFIDEKDVDSLLYQIADGALEGKSLNEINLSLIEKTLQQNKWIKKAEVYFDNNEVLWVNINEREPIARILTKSGQSFYIDSGRATIPLSEKFSARLPIFTNFPVNTNSHADSNLLSDVKLLSEYVEKDPFWMAQIDQIDIADDYTFQLIPKIGNQVIQFGNIERYKEKFQYLFLFYRDVLSKVGWNKYSKISVEYAGQIVSVKRGAEDVKMDSLKASEIMKNILLKAQMQIADTSGIQLAQKDEQSLEVIPLINPDLPDENITLSSKRSFHLAGNINELNAKADSSAKKKDRPDSVFKTNKIYTPTDLSTNSKKSTEKKKAITVKKPGHIKPGNTDY